MPCDHVGPHEVIALAEGDLRAREIDAAAGMRFRHGENTPDGMWASVVIEIERRGDQWIVTRLDRSREALADSEIGLREI